MNLKQPLLKLPINFCAETLAAEVRALPKSAWEPHPQGFAGNEAVPLVTPDGRLTNDFAGAMSPTEHLLRCPYMMAVMADLGAVWGRSRLMGLGPGAEVPLHIDIHYYWRTHLRLHIPIITNPGVQLTCAGESVHMAGGECWLLDTFRGHGVQNRGTQQRVHLVLDTVGGERLWELINAAQAAGATSDPLRHVVTGQTKVTDLAFERVNLPKVMSPWEIRCHLAFLQAEVIPEPGLDMVTARLDKFIAGWTAAWTRFADIDEGLPTYRELIANVRHDLQAIGAAQIKLHNGRPLYLVLDALIFANAVAALPSAQRDPWAPPGSQRRLRAS